MSELKEILFYYSSDNYKTLKLMHIIQIPVQVYSFYHHLSLYYYKTLKLATLPMSIELLCKVCYNISILYFYSINLNGGFKMVAIETTNVINYINEYGISPELFAKEHNISNSKALEILNDVSSGKSTGLIIIK